jgi:HD-GYP domain-containing protein (c-di-GMP phosphodiesterase class II)
VNVTEQMEKLESIVVRGLQAGIANCRVRGDVLPDLVAMLHAGLHRLLDRSGAQILRGAGQFLLLNGTRLPREDSDRVFARRLSRALRERGLEGLRFEPGLTVKELHAALRILGRAGAMPGRTRIPVELRDAQVQHVLPLVIEERKAYRPPVGPGLSIHRRQAQHLYLTGLDIVQEWVRASDQSTEGDTLMLDLAAMEEDLHEFVQFDTGELPYEVRGRLRRTKRLLQRMIDLMQEDDASLLGLTIVKSLENYAVTHAVNVAILAMALGRTAGLPKTALLRLGMAGLLHDLGQLDVPPEVLQQSGALSSEQWAAMQRHTLAGAARVLRSGPLTLMSDAALVALEHHLGMSGQGYPRARSAELPALMSRIIHLVDTYDALTSRRNYRHDAIQPDRVIGWMLHDPEGRFDPLLVKLFVHTLGLYPPGSTVELDSGCVGVVVRANRVAHLLARPQVCVLLEADGTTAEVGAYVDLSETLLVSEGERGRIEKSVDPEEYGISPAAVFLAEV